MNARNLLPLTPAIVAAALLAGGAAALAQSVSVNFVNSGSGGIDNSQAASLLPAELAGAPGYKQTNWNNLSRYGSGVTLTNSVGAATPLTINWDAGWTGSSGTAAGLGTPDGKLMDGSLRGNTTIVDYTALTNFTSVYGMPVGAKPMTYVGGLNAWCLSQGAVGYTIVVYQTAHNWWDTAEMWVQSVSGSPVDNTMLIGPDLTPHLWNVLNSTFNGTYSQIPATATNSASQAYGASYGVFSSLTNDAVLIRTGDSSENWGNGSMCGFQIIPIYPPKPSVGVNFINSGSGGIDNSQPASLLPAEIAGAPGYKQTNWNNLSRYGSGVTLTNSVGAATPLTINWDAGWTGSSGTAAGLGTPDGKLMDGSLRGNTTIVDYTALTNFTSVYGMPVGAKPMAYVGGLNAWCLSQGAVGYTIVVYQTAHNWWDTAEMWVQSVSGSPVDNTMLIGPDLTPHLWNVLNSTFNGTYSQIPATATNSASQAYGASHGVFSSLTNDAVLIRTGDSSENWGNGSMCGFQIIPIPGPTINHAPVAGSSFSMGATIGTPTTVKIIGGKWAPTDVDNDALVISGVTGAANGTVNTDGTNITYTATSGTSDSFSYTVSDQNGGTATTNISVTITAPSQGFNQLGAQMVSGNAHLTYLGIPGTKYALDWTHSLTPPVTWEPLVTNTAAGNGYLLFTNTPSGGSDFYRTRYVP